TAGSCSLGQPQDTLRCLLACLSLQKKTANAGSPSSPLTPSKPSRQALLCTSGPCCQPGRSQASSQHPR
uniref:Uncharacterized protein n=1 Tax=Strix occidentalis caurina TaxID=311401 RepID=A0A8D0FZL6_STROC